MVLFFRILLTKCLCYSSLCCPTVSAQTDDPDGTAASSAMVSHGSVTEIALPTQFDRFTIEGLGQLLPY